MSCHKNGREEADHITFCLPPQSLIQIISLFLYHQVWQKLLLLPQSLFPPFSIISISWAQDIPAKDNISLPPLQAVVAIWQNSGQQNTGEVSVTSTPRLNREGAGYCLDPFSTSPQASMQTWWWWLEHPCGNMRWKSHADDGQSNKAVDAWVPIPLTTKPALDYPPRLLHENEIHFYFIKANSFLGFFL